MSFTVIQRSDKNLRQKTLFLQIFINTMDTFICIVCVCILTRRDSFNSNPERTMHSFVHRVASPPILSSITNAFLVILV